MNRDNGQTEVLRVQLIVEAYHFVVEIIFHAIWLVPRATSTHAPTYATRSSSRIGQISNASLGLTRIS